MSDSDAAQVQAAPPSAAGPVGPIGPEPIEASPYGLESKKLGIWLFITADAVTFAVILFGYGYLRVGTPRWPRPFEFYPTILNAVVMTVVLLTSSLTMIVAGHAARLGRWSASVRWLGVTAVLGALFAALHLREWFGMFARGWRPGASPPGELVLFGATFFSITGLHLLHVVSGVVAILVIAVGVQRARFDAGHIETVGLYWHFVDLVWMYVFPLVYLMNAR